MGTGTVQLPCALMRGGTSKAVFLRPDVLPAEPEARDRLLLALMGSPDVRQIDGLGGGNAPTSKVAVVGPSAAPDADVDYTFVQVSCVEPALDYSGNCGNISAAVGPYAIEEGLVPAVEPTTVVRIRNTNTGVIIVAEVPVVDGAPAVDGDLAIAGVPGTGAPVTLDYSLTAGAVTGSLLPTGAVVETLRTDAYGDVTVSVVDLANVVIYVRAEDVRQRGTEGPADYTAADLRGLEEIRGRVAVCLGMCAAWEDAAVASSMFPLVTVVAPPADYLAWGSNAPVAAADVDLLVRMQVLRALHPAYAGTGMANTAMAALLDGSVVQSVLRPGPVPGDIRLGHPTGVATVTAAAERRGDTWVPKQLSYQRTARRLLSGTAHVRAQRLER